MTQATKTLKPDCLLCGGRECQVTDQLTGEQLRALWRTADYQFTPEAWGEVGENTLVEQLQCQGCGFTFFDPKFSGNEAFYRQIERPGYYCPTRPEFDRTANLAKTRGLRRVLDVGCGSGFFLDQARGVGCETSGLELNTAAAEKARAKGHRVFSRLLHELNRDETGGGYDLITLFQVLEHVSQPVSVMKDAARFLNPGGIIVVAVPGAEGVNRLCPWSPYDWPPHHTSRWRTADLRQLALQAQLKLLKADGDVMVGSLIEQLWQLHNKIAPLLGKSTRPGGKWLPKIISQAYRKTALKHLFPHWGVSIYGYFQKD
ncbi:MAG: class I SAM-dependent methyltransferase [Akkermansiaceae bacterium]|nr:class I SAM-dependent methyltransferase [Verrucomicrobiales bacterium]